MTAPRPIPTWPVWVLAAPAGVAIWSGWVGLGRKAGFGEVQPFPGIPTAEDWTLDTSITLPIGMETYAAFALWVWLSGRAPAPVARFAQWSAIGALLVGFLGQAAYHLLEAANVHTAPWQITLAVSGVPVVVLGLGAALAHMLHAARLDVEAAADEAPLVYGPQTPPITSPEATSPAAGEAHSAVPGAGGTPPAAPPRGRSTTSRPPTRRGTGTAAGRTNPGPSREDVAAAYIRDTPRPTVAGMKAAIRSETGSGMNNQAATDLYRTLTEAIPEPSPAPLHAVPGDVPSPSREEVPA